jgi:parallel beta-helix repeat protein
MRFRTVFLAMIFCLVVLTQFSAIPSVYASQRKWEKGNNIRNAADYPSIQDAIDSLPLIGGTVLIPAGTYIISTPIIVQSHVTLIGEGFDTLLKLADEANTDVIRNKHRLAWIDEDITVANMQIDGNKEKQTGPASGIYFSTVRNARLENLWIHDFPKKYLTGYMLSLGIHLEGSREAVIQHNIIENNGYTGIFVGFSHYSVVSRNYLYGNHRGIYLRNSNYVKVTKNEIINCDEGVRIYYDASYNRIIGNYIEGSSEEGIVITRAECKDNFISGNYLVNNAIQINDQGTNNKMPHNKLIST